MSSNPLSNYAIAWLYIDGNIIQNDVHGFSYDRPMSRLIKLHVTLNFKQLCDVICAKLNVDSKLYGLNIMHRCFNPVTKMYGVAPVLDDDDVELMFELVTSLGVKNSVVELYLERVLVSGVVEKGVDVDVDVDFSGGQAGVLFDFDLEVSRDSGKCGGNVAFGRGSGGGGIVEGCGDLGKRGGDSRDLGGMAENVGVIRDLGGMGENMEVIRDLGESGGSNKKMLYMQHVNSQGRRVSRGRNKGGEGGIPFYSTFDGSSMVASVRQPVFTMSGNVLHVKDLKKGMVFVSREELADVVYQVHYRNQQEVKVIRANSLNWTVVCKRKASGCMWRLQARKRKHHGFFEIMSISEAHTCVNPTVTQDHANLIFSKVEVPDVQVAVGPSL